MQTLFIGKNIIFLPETQSTNSYATDMLKNVNLPEGTIIHTANQTMGKGQRGGVWKADPASNLTTSVILKPTFLELKNQFFLYEILALACYDTMSELLNSSQIDIKIKWPNDILINKRKIAGILIENNITNNRFNWSVAGVGINVNQLLFPEEMRATSMRLVSGIPWEISRVMEQFCIKLEKYYLMLKTGHLEKIREIYLSRMIGIGTWMRFESSGNTIDYLVEGISDGGLLMLRGRSGVMKEVDVKEVKWLF